MMMMRDEDDGMMLLWSSIPVWDYLIGPQSTLPVIMLSKFYLGPGQCGNLLHLPGNHLHCTISLRVCP